MLEGEYINNNSRFCKPTKKGKNELFIQNIVFIYSDSLVQDMQALLVEKDINTIRLTSSNFKLNNLDFLKNYNLSFIKSIDILSDSVKDIEGLYSLESLESINSINQKIDYSRFPKLRSISGELNNSSYSSLESINTLEFISISNKFKNDDVTIFSKNIDLRYLMLRGSKLKTLKGLENFESLESLNLLHNKSLETLEGVTNKHVILKEIAIYVAPRLFVVDEYLSQLPWLEYLQLKAKKIDSFKFLDKLTNLNTLGIHNKLNDCEDGDKAPLVRALKRTNSKIW